MSIIVFRDNGHIKYKVTKRVPEMGVAETKMFDNLEEAKKQQEEWLRE